MPRHGGASVSEIYFSIKGGNYSHLHCQTEGSDFISYSHLNTQTSIMLYRGLAQPLNRRASLECGEGRVTWLFSTHFISVLHHHHHLLHHLLLCDLLVQCQSSFFL